MDRGAWWATVHGGLKESDMTNTFTFCGKSKGLYSLENWTCCCRTITKFGREASLLKTRKGGFSPRNEGKPMGNCALHGFLKPSGQHLEAEWDPAKDKSPHGPWKAEDDKNQDCKCHRCSWTSMSVNVDWYLQEQFADKQLGLCPTGLISQSQGCACPHVSAQRTDPTPTQGRKGVGDAWLHAVWDFQLCVLET